MIHQCMEKWQWEHDSSSLEYDRPQLEQITVSSMYFPANQWIKTKVFSAKSDYTNFYYMKNQDVFCATGDV